MDTESTGIEHKEVNTKLCVPGEQGPGTCWLLRRVAQEGRKGSREGEKPLALWEQLGGFYNGNGNVQGGAAAQEHHSTRIPSILWP